MDNSIANNGFMGTFLQHLTQRSKSVRTSRTRKPIFQQISRSKNLHQSVTIFNQSNSNLKQQRLTSNQLIQSHFCGCEQNLSPCSIINNNFIVNVSLDSIKKEYNKLEQPFLATNPTRITHNKRLMMRLPSTFPQIYFTPLNNILNTIYTNQSNKLLSLGQFLCLSSLLYHCKLQYLAFFFFYDLKKSFTKFSNFLQELNLSFVKYNTSYENIKLQKRETISSIKWDHFIEQYFDSVGSNIIPCVHFAKFIKIIPQRGKRVLAMLLSYLLIRYQSEITEIIKLFQFNQIEELNKRVNSLDWQDILQKLEKN